MASTSVNRGLLLLMHDLCNLNKQSTTQSLMGAIPLALQLLLATFCNTSPPSLCPYNTGVNGGRPSPRGLDTRVAPPHADARHEQPPQLLEQV